MYLYPIRNLIINKDSSIEFLIDSIFDSYVKARNYLEADLFKGIKKIDSEDFENMLTKLNLKIYDISEVYLLEQNEKQYYYFINEIKLN